MEWCAKWIRPSIDMGDIVPLYSRQIRLTGHVRSAVLSITALGVYEACLDGIRIGAFILAPGWTTYSKRLQYQRYDISDLFINKDLDVTRVHTLEVVVGKGRYPFQRGLEHEPGGLLAQMDVCYTDGREETFITDNNWKVGESCIRYSEIYDGEIFDASFHPDAKDAVTEFYGPDNTLIPQQGPETREQERISAAEMLITPNGETVLDFGQEITGYVETSLSASAGDILDLSHAEVLDQKGNFYTENYRKAKSQYHYICRDGKQTYKPLLTFMGFRYIRINAYPGGIDKARPENFTAVVVHSDMKRTGHLQSSDPLLNRLFENAIWSQKGNFLDVPTDCPQRDERLGWTGDAQVFIRSACLNFDVEQFFTKWLADLAADQTPDGRVGFFVPDVAPEAPPSAAWGDAAAICPWELYLSYGTEPLPAKAGRFGLLLKQPKVVATSLISLPT